MSSASSYGLAGVAVVAAGLAACRPQAAAGNQGVRADVQFDPSPPRVGDTALRIRLTDAAGAPIRAAALEVEGDMRHAGMKPVFGTLPETSAGQFQGHLTFDMGGDWVLILSGRTAAGRAFAAQVDVPGVRSR